MHVQPNGTPAPQGRHRGGPAVMLHLARAGAHRTGGGKARWITAAVLGTALVAIAIVAWLILH